MSEADELFEKANYYKSYDYEDQIKYRNTEEDTEVIFYNSLFKRYMVTDVRGESKLVTLRLHKAINKKIEELRWYNETT